MPELMWVLLVLAVVVGVGGGWLLSKGRGGAMPEVVDDRPQPRIPEGRFEVADLDAVRFARSGQGYDTRAVDDLLTSARAAIETPDQAGWDELRTRCGQARFAMTRNGYQMTQVDAVLDRLAHQFATEQAPSSEPVEPSAQAHAPAREAQQHEDAE